MACRSIVWEPYCGTSREPLPPTLWADKLNFFYGYAISQPAEVDVSEIVVRPAVQDF